MHRWWSLLFSSALLLSAAFAQDARESLGPKDKPATANAPHPLTQLMATKTATLKAELRGVHPRVYVTSAEIKQLQQRARTTHRESWQQVLANLRALKQAPPPAQ